MDRFISFYILALIFLSACAPEIQERQFEQPPKTFGPRFGDTDLSQNLKPVELTRFALSWQGVVPTSVYFQQAENLVVLGKATENESLMNKGFKWIENFYQQPKTTSYTEFSQSPFATMAATATETEVQKTLTEVQQDLERARKILKIRIKELGESYPWARTPVNLNTAIAQASAFADMVYQQVGQMGLPSLVIDGLRAELKSQTGTLFADMSSRAGQLYTAKYFSKALVVVEGMIEKFQVKLEGDVERRLAHGRIIAADLDGLKDAQGGLTVLIDIWKGLTLEEREKYFKTENESLYEFLSDQDEKSLNCLRLEGCSGGIFKGIAKKLFVLPRIKDYGIEALHAKLNEKILAHLMLEIDSFAISMLRDLPETFMQQIDQGLVAKAQELAGIQNNYSGYLKELLTLWARKNLTISSGRVAGFEAPSLNLNISKQSKFSLNSVSDALDLKASTAGATMGANALLLQDPTKATSFKMQSALSQVNKLIAIGGYRNDQKKLIHAILCPIEKTRTPLDLMNFSKSNLSYRIPDKIKLLDSFRVADDVFYEKDFSAAAFAEQIRGLSQMLRVTADWKKSGFDDTLGKIRAQELTQEVQSPSLDRALFPKDMIFALNLGDAAVLLKSITKKSTPVFLITLDNKTIWADQYTSGGSETPIMAGLVDIKDGKRSNTVQSQDVAKFLISIAEFIKATEGAEKTKSDILHEKDENGRTPLQALVEGRKDLRLLVLALANFISNQLMNEQALVQSTYYLTQMERSNNPEYLIEDQVYAIRALIAAWQVTQLDAYMNSAQEIYFALNKNAFSQQDRFYVNGDGTALTFPQRVHTLRAMVELKPYLAIDSQAQLDQIIAPWLTALTELP